jgi:excisionase family DNA binding protein
MNNTPRPVVLVEGITLEDFFTRLEALIDQKLEERFAREKEAEVRYLTAKEVCALLQISTPTLYAWTKQGLIPSYRIGSRVRYKSTEIDHGLKERKYRLR